MRRKIYEELLIWKSKKDKKPLLVLGARQVGKTYIEKFNPKYSIRISTKNFGFVNGIKSVPLYAVFCIDSD